MRFNLRGICVFLVFVLLMGMGMLAGCARNDVAQPDVAQPCDNDVKGTVGLAFRQLAATWSRGILMGAENRLLELGYMTTVTDARLDPHLQLKQVDAFIELGVEGVIMVPQDPAVIIPGLEKLRDHGVPVYVVDTQPKGGHWDLFIVFDNVVGGVKAGEAMEKLLLERHGDNPQGVVLEIMGDPRHIAAGQRSEGFRSVFVEHDGIEIVSQPADWIPDKAFTVTVDLLHLYGDNVIGITMASDVMAPGVIHAIRKANLEKPQGDPDRIFVTAIDGDPEGLAMVREGLIDAIALQPFNYYGSMAADYLYKHLRGEKVEFYDGQIIEEAGAPWSPAVITVTEYGPIKLLSSVIIPWDICVDDPRLWGNQVR